MTPDGMRPGVDVRSRGPHWSAARQRVAVIALLSATASAGLVAALGGSLWHVFGASAYIGIVAAALLFPASIVMQVVAGQLLAGSLLLAPARAGVLLIAVVIAGVVATAELLAAAARLEAPRGRGVDLRRAWVAAAIGGAVFGVVMLAGRLPGPTGMLAIVLGAAACSVVALLLLSGIRRRAEPATSLHVE